MSIHISAKKGDIAPTVLLPGDPLRAKWIAEAFLEEVICYNEIRGMLGYTGHYQGKRISVQGSGMGIPSALIYCYELINEYDVKNLIRVGTAGSYQEDLGIGDVVLAMAASTTSSINNSIFQTAHYAPTASFELFNKACSYAQRKGIPFRAGNVLSADEFYDDPADLYHLWSRYGVLCVEMETAGIYTMAARHGVQALSILTISDSLLTKERSTPEKRESGFREMVEIALNVSVG